MIQSVLDQSFVDFELIICDDNTSDDCRDVICEFARHDTRILSFRNEHASGLLGSYNQCLKRASGKYIKPLDQFNVLAPSALKTMRQVLEDHSRVVLTSFSNTIANSCIRTPERTTSSISIPREQPVAGTQVIQLSLCPINNFVGEPSEVMFRKYVAGTGFNEAYSQIGVLEYWLRILRLGHYYNLKQQNLCSPINVRSDTIDATDNMIVPTSNGKGATIRASIETISQVCQSDVVRFAQSFKKEIEGSGLSREQYILQCSTASKEEPAAEAEPTLGEPAGVPPLRSAFECASIDELRGSRLFDRLYYLKNNQDIASNDEVDPLTHYFFYGGFEGRDPHPLFDSSYYLEQYPFVAHKRANPLSHYLTEGAGLGLNPHPLFSTAFYLAQVVSLEECSFNPLVHFIESGARRGLDPHPLFDSSFYLRQLERLEGCATEINPLVHYLTVGAGLGLQPSPIFDGNSYLERYPDVVAARANPLLHFVTVGHDEGRSGATSDWIRGFFRKKVRSLEETIAIPTLHEFGYFPVSIEPSFAYDVLRLLEKTLPIKDFVDVGSHIGETLIELRLFSPLVRYIGFEPNPLAFSILTDLVRANNFQCIIVPCGLSDSSVVLPLFKSSPLDAAATILPDSRPGKYREENGEFIVCLPLDDVIEKIGTLSKHFVLKIDVEGAEHKVLLGASKCISTLRPIILCEVLHSHNEESLLHSQEHKRVLAKFLSDFGYSIFQIELHQGQQDNLHRQRLKSLRRIREFPVDIYENSPHTCEFLFLPEELDDNVELS